jgi:hypothetical protein
MGLGRNSDGDREGPPVCGAGKIRHASANAAGFDAMNSQASSHATATASSRKSITGCSADARKDHMAADRKSETIADHSGRFMNAAQRLRRNAW